MSVVELGNTELENELTDDAIRYYERARVLDQNLIHVYNRLGMAHSRSGNYDGWASANSPG